MNTNFTYTNLEKKPQLANVLYQIADKAYGVSPWREEQFSSDLKGAYTHYLGAYNEKAQLVAFVSWQALFDEVEITNVAVLPSYQGQKIADHLCQRLWQELSGEARIFLEVRQSNLPAQKLYLKHGFQVINQRKNYYHQPVEDALIMEKIISEKSGIFGK